MNFIDKTSELETLCSSLSKQPFVTVDFEFLREKTYFAKPCLIQIGSSKKCAIIDPLSEGLSLQSFFDLMQNKSVTKVFHSGRQDIEIIFNLSGKIPTPLFDTQIAAMVCGFGESISYENLVKSILGITLDKSSRLSDWSKRPLNDKQLEYALSDVTHLVNIYTYLKDYLEKNNRLHWIDEEMAILNNPSNYIINPQDAWKRIRHHSHNARFLTILRELAAWREERSQRRNIPRQRYIKDEALLTICSSCPQNKEELSEIRSLPKDIAAGKLGDEIVEVIKQAINIPPEEYVTPPEIKIPFSQNSPLSELLKMLLKIISQQNKVVARVIASDEDLSKLSSFKDNDCSALQGWRYEIFGSQALKLRNGELSIGYNPKNHHIEFYQNSKN